MRLRSDGTSLTLKQGPKRQVVGPPERILARYPRTLANLAGAVRLADVAILYESVDVEHGVPLLGAACVGKRTTLLTFKLPRWMATMLGTA